MEALFSAVNAICGKIQIVSNWFWDFPTNLDWYASIPILGNFSLAIILLVGTGIYFTFKLRFVQVRKFKYGLQGADEQQEYNQWASLPWGRSCCPRPCV